MKKQDKRITNAHISDFRLETSPFNTEVANFLHDLHMAHACQTGTLRKMNHETGKTEVEREYYFTSHKAVEEFGAISVKHAGLVAEEQSIQARADAEAAMADEHWSFGANELHGLLGRTVRAAVQSQSHERTLIAA